jgi:hypothetical protein
MIQSTPSLLSNNLTVKLVESGYNEEKLVTDATINCVIENHNGIERGPFLLEQTKHGIYYAFIIMTEEDIGSVTFKFTVIKDNYELANNSQELSTDIIDPWPPMVGPIVRNSVPISLVTISMISVVIAQRAYSRRKRKQNLEALAVKRRFDDLKNLIGILVLHKRSGLPIYSKMLTTGFDSSMISAFITAIRNFRSEIETDTAEREFYLTPISDIVRVVATHSLLCAFITVSTPTPTQSEKMIEFAKAASFLFDDLFEMIPTEIVDNDTVEQFEYLFDEKLDGKLLKKFRMAEHEKFPRRLKCVEEKFEHLETTDGFELDDLAAGVASCGLEEARAYKIIIDYIEKGSIIPLNPEEKQILGFGREAETEGSSDDKSEDETDSFTPLED